jgi:hypothetical protein
MKRLIEHHQLVGPHGLFLVYQRDQLAAQHAHTLSIESCVNHISDLGHVYGPSPKPDDCHGQSLIS